MNLSVLIVYETRNYDTDFLRHIANLIVEYYMYMQYHKLFYLS